MLELITPLNGKMSNFETISEHFCSLACLKNYLLCAYPNFLILGKALKTLHGIKFEKKTYFKIRTLDFERWFDLLNVALDWLNCNELSVVNQIIIEEPEFQYSIYCAVMNDKRELQIKQNQNGEELMFQFDLHELKGLMVSMADLLMYSFCLEENVLKTFSLFIKHYLCLTCSVEKGSKKIANLNYAKIFAKCQLASDNHEIEGSLFVLTDFILKHKVLLLIIYRVHKTCVLPSSNLIEKYL